MDLRQSKLLLAAAVNRWIDAEGLLASKAGQSCNAVSAMSL